MFLLLAFTTVLPAIFYLLHITFILFEMLFYLYSLSCSHYDSPMSTCPPHQGRNYFIYLFDYVSVGPIIIPAT